MYWREFFVMLVCWGIGMIGVVCYLWALRRDRRARQNTRQIGWMLVRLFRR